MSSTPLYLVIIRLHRCCSAKRASICPLPPGGFCNLAFSCSRFPRLSKIDDCASGIAPLAMVTSHESLWRYLSSIVLSHPCNFPSQTRGRPESVEETGGALLKPAPPGPLVTTDQHRNDDIRVLRPHVRLSCAARPSFRCRCLCGPVVLLVGSSGRPESNSLLFASPTCNP